MTETEADRAAQVEAAADDLVASFASHDRERYFDAFTVEATFVFHTSAQILTARSAYEQEWSKWEADGFHVDSCTSTERRIDLVTPDVAILTHSVTTQIRGVDQAQRERETIVFRRTQGRWLAVHEHLSLDPRSEGS